MRRRLSVIIFILLLIGAGVAVWKGSHANDPVIHGKRLSAWLVDKASGDLRVRNQAIDAIREAGTNGLPLMVEMLQAQDSVIKQTLVRLVGKQRVLKFYFTDTSALRRGSLAGFQLLGPAAEPSVPSLGKLITVSNAADNATAALVFIGRPAVVAFCGALTNEAAWVWLQALRGLYGLHYTVPFGPKTSWNEDPLDAECDRKVIVPCVVDRTLDWDQQVREMAKATLSLVSSTTPSVVPILLLTWTNRLESPDARVRRYTVESVFSSSTVPAASVAPMLIERLTDPDKNVRESAADAFRKADRIFAWTNRYPDLLEQLRAVEWGPYLANRPKDLPQDPEIHKRLIGTWAVDQKLASGTHRKGVLTLGADGTFTSRSRIVPANEQGWDYEDEGTWEVMGGFIILHSGLGVDHDRIIQMDEHTLILERAGLESNGILVRPLQIERIRYTRTE
jgi:hypothetical protein